MYMTYKANGILFDDLYQAKITSPFDLDEWVSDFAYPKNAIAKVGNAFYISTDLNNLGNVPTDLPGENSFWSLFRFLTLYNSTTSYAIGQTTFTANGKMWASISNSNIDNDPLLDIHNTYWEPAAGENLRYRKAVFTATEGQTDFYPNANFSSIHLLFVEGISQIDDESYELVQMGNETIIRTLPLSAGQRVLAVIGQEIQYIEPEQVDFRYVRYPFFPATPTTQFVLPVNVKQILYVIVNGLHQTPVNAYEFDVNTQTVTLASGTDKDVLIYAGDEPPIEGDAGGQIVAAEGGTKTSSLAGWTQDIVENASNITSNTANIENNTAEIDNNTAELASNNTIVSKLSKQSDGSDLGEKLKNHTFVRGMYYRRDGAGVFMVGYGMSEEDLDDKWVVEYRFQENGDGLFLLRGGYSGREDISSRMALSTLVGTYVTTSAPITYTTTVGDTVTAAVTGKTLILKSRTESRGGLWKVTLSTGEVSYVSCYSSTTIDGVEQTVFKDLDYKARTVELEFMGDDPLNPPSSSPSRGYVYSNGTVADKQPLLFAKVGFIDESTRQDIISSSSVPDFAVRCKPLGATYSSEWVPNHGTLGSTIAINTGMSIDGVRISSAVGVTPATGYDFVECDSFILAQNFNAVNPNGADGTMWFHLITHSFNSSEPSLTLDNSLTLGQDVDVSSAYLAMLPSESQYIDRLVYNNGTEINTFLADGENYYTGWNVDSVAFIGEYEAGRGHGVSLTIAAINETGALGKSAQANSLIRFWDRTDGIVKVYYTASEGGTWEAGRKLTSSNKYTLISGVRSPANHMNNISSY
jgi:hypothetical protein